MPPVSPVPTRNAILEAATKLFLEKGVSATSLSSVAQRAGVTKSLIHHHFATKGNLWMAVKNQMMEEYAVVQQKMLIGQDLDMNLFIDSMDMYFRFLARRPEFVTLITVSCMEAARDGDAASESFHQSMGTDLFRLGLSAIVGAQKKGVIRDDLAPGFILATALGIAEGWFLKRGWNQHCVDEIPRDPSRADEWYRPQFGRFLERALAPK